MAEDIIAGAGDGADGAARNNVESILKAAGRLRAVPKAEKPLPPPRVGPGDWRDQLIVKILDDGREQVLCRVHNLILIFQNAIEFQGRIKCNQFANTLEIDGEEISDGAMARLKAQVERHYITDKVPTTDVIEALNGLAPLVGYHPIRDYLEALTWDGVERIEYFFPDYLGTPKDLYHMGCARAFFVSAVARIYQPGVKVDLMTILEGAQGGGKSSLWETLGGDWYADITDDINNKDFQGALQGVWIADLGELDQFGRAESSRIKTIVSIKKDRLRRPYAKFHINIPRSTILVGGSNRTDWLNDPTGGRRFLPVSCKVEKIDLDALRAARDQLWAEAVHRYRAGDAGWWDVPNAAEHQFARYNEDPWQRPIEEWLIGRTRCNSADILSGCLRIDLGKQTRSDETRVGNVMLRIPGWKRIQEWNRELKKPVRLYVRQS
jgi:putative DNA primase/helicase